jgi:superfamily II DNA or RNA helicase
MSSLHLDIDALRQLAPEAVVRRGISAFREHRVLSLCSDESSLSAEVDDQPTSVVLAVHVEGERLISSCTCSQADATVEHPACHHVVAALLAHAARAPIADEVTSSAAEEAKQERIKRGRLEVAVLHLRGDEVFGVWEARSVGGGSGARHEVHLLSLSRPLNHCTCADFATNELDTCKHIEGVVHHLRKRLPARFERLVQKGPSFAVAYADRSQPTPVLRVHPGWRPLAPAVHERLDAGLCTPGDWPDAAEAFVAFAHGRDDLVVHPGVHTLISRTRTEAARIARTAAVEQVMRPGARRLHGVQAELLPHQMAGAAFLASRGRAVLADDMGLGKTVQAIAAATWMVHHEGVRRILIVCPASLKHQWAGEIRRFSQLQVEVVQGGMADRLEQYKRPAQVLVTNYALLRRDVQSLQRHLQPDLLIVDEAQQIKNWNTQTATAIKAVPSRFAFVLTGTPLENRLEDLYSVMQLVDPAVLGPLWRFQLDHQVSSEYGRVLGYRGLASLRRRLAPVVLRRDRTVLEAELPERVDQVIEVDLDRAQSDLNHSAVDAARNLINRAQEEGRPMTPSERNRFMASLQRARLACNAAGLLNPDHVGSPKLDALEEQLRRLLAEGRKVVIFSTWCRMLDLVEEVCRQQGAGFVRLDGSVPSHRRGERIERFHDDPDCRVFLASDAGGTGLNLQCASALINVDVPWNPAVLEQRIGRIHRFGQREAVRIIHLIARRGYEGQVAAHVANKAELFRHTFGADATEDVIGVSSKQVLSLLSSMDEEEAPQVATEEVSEAQAPLVEEPPSVVEPAPPARSEVPGRPSASLPEDPSLAPLLATLCAMFGARIERVLAAGGGLVLVLDAVTESDRLSLPESEVELVLLDRHAASGLLRLGALGSIATPPPTVSPRQRASAKLRAARALIDAACPTEAFPVLLEALDATLSLLTRSEPRPAYERVRWILHELAPARILTMSQAFCLAGLATLDEAACATYDLKTAAVCLDLLLDR